jgi:hypothetical protein
METTMTYNEWCSRSVTNYLSNISIPRTTRTNWREFASAWSSKYGGTWQNAYWVWRVTYHEEHSRDLSKPYIPLDKHE